VNLCRRLAALLVLALGGCAQVVTGQGQAASAPYCIRTGGPCHDGGDGGSSGMQRFSPT
jgi:hypothetical protein